MICLLPRLNWRVGKAREREETWRDPLHLLQLGKHRHLWVFGEVKGWFLFLGLRRVWPRWVKWEGEFCKRVHIVSHLWSVLIVWDSWKTSFVIFFSFGYLVLGQARKCYWIGVLKALYEGKEQTRGYAPDKDSCDQNNSVSMLSQNKLEGYQASLKLRREWHNNYSRTHPLFP